MTFIQVILRWLSESRCNKIDVTEYITISPKTNQIFFLLFKYKFLCTYIQTFINIFHIFTYFFSLYNKYSKFTQAP